MLLIFVLCIFKFSSISLMQMAMNKKNDEATKIVKKTNAIAAIKSKPAYILTLSRQLDKQIQEPDPFEKMSKRKWERSMMKWRAELRALVEELSV